MSQKFCNILVTWETIWQLRMYLPRLWRWRTALDFEILGSPYTLRFVSMVWSTASESTVLSLPNLSRQSRFLQPSEISSTICLLYCDQLRFYLSLNKSLWLHLRYHDPVRTRNDKFPNKTMLHVHQCSFQLTHKVKQYMTCQRTNYHHTTNYSG